MKTRFFLPLVIASLSVMAARNLCAQDPMAQWKPSAGDKFVYYQTWEDGTYWHGSPYHVESGTDTLTMEILSTDSAYNDSYQHVVAVWNTIPQRKISYKSFYYYHPGANLSSAHPFAIDLGDSLCTNCVTSYDFSIARDTQVTYQTNPLAVYAFAHYSQVNGNPNSSHSNTAQYSPDFKWYYSESSSDYEPTPGSFTYDGSFGTSTLISAVTVHSAVQQQPAPGYAPMTVVQSANFLTITLHSTFSISPTQHSALRTQNFISLLDPLGRTIRSWPVQSEADGQRITLNIADLPSGVYFLMLEAPGMSQVKKLAIVR